MEDQPCALLGHATTRVDLADMIEADGTWPFPWSGRMEERDMKRKLATIMVADIVGFSRLAATNEDWTIRTLGEFRRVVAEGTGLRRAAARARDVIPAWQ